MLFISHQASAKIPHAKGFHGGSLSLRTAVGIGASEVSSFARDRVFPVSLLSLKMLVFFLVPLQADARGLCTLKSLHLQTQFTNFSKATVLASPLAPPIETSASEAQIPVVVEISSSCEVSVGGMRELKQPLNFGVTSGGGRASCPIVEACACYFGEQEREIRTIIK